MIDLLAKIWHTIAAIGDLVLWAIVSAINLLVAALGAAITFLLSLLPSMPAPPSEPAAEWIGWLNWLFPLAAILTLAASFLALYVLMLAIRIGLRWVKAL